MAESTARLAKLSRPTLAGVASRARLFSQLDKFRDSPVIWVSGPPGSGKTTLVADYLDTFALDYAWYQLDQGDADVATFFHYMGQELVRRDPAVGGSLPGFSPEYFTDLPAFSGRYFREFFSRLATPFALVFDNYHEVPGQSRLHEVIRDGLEEIPEGGCVLIIGRTDPPPAFARLRANQQMMVLGWNDLKLNQEETNAIVDLRGLEVPDAVRVQLYERTQGWAVGTVLMLEHMRSEGTVAEVPTAFTPNVIFDYLAGEVIKHLEDEQQHFLLQTAILTDMTPELAEDLTGRNDAAAILADVARRDYFVSIKQTDEGVAYQYHPLLREFLQKRAADTLGAEALGKLQTRAAELLEKTGHTEDSIALRIGSHEWSEVARLIREHASALLSQGRGETVEGWLEEIPREQLRQDPWLLYWLGACRLRVGPRESRREYEKAYELFRSQGEPEVDGLFKACSGALGAILYDLDDLTLLDHWIEEVQRLHKEYPDFPESEYGEWTTCHMYMALVLRQPFHPDIEHWGERVYKIFHRAKATPVRLQAAIVLVSSIVWTGRFAKVTEIIESIRQLAHEPQESPFVLTTLHVVESMNYMLDGQYDRCMEAVRNGLEVAKTSGVHIWENSTLLNGAGGALGEGDLETAEEFLGQLDSSALGVRRFDSCMAQFLRAWLALLKGDALEAFQQQRAGLRLATDMGLPFFEVIGGIALGQILFECGDQRKGATYLREVRRAAKKINNRYLEFMSLVFYAALALEHGRPAPGLRALEYAFKLGREMGYSNTIWWQPKMMSRLAATALANDIEVDYVKRLIRRRKLVPEGPALDMEEWPWEFRIRALGAFSLQRDGDPEVFRGKHGKPLDLLKVSVALGGRDISVDRITDVLWPRIDADYAHRSFNTTLHRLRKLLGDDRAVVLAGGRLSLDERWFWLDAWCFERTLAEASELLRESHEFVDYERLMEVANRAMGLYTGPFMADEDAAWALAARDAWQRRFVRFADGVAAYLIDSGRSGEAIAFLDRGLEADELAEGLYRSLMRCYEQLDRPAEAIEVFARCRKTLAARLDSEPSAETRQIYEQVTSRSAGQVATDG